MPMVKTDTQARPRHPPHEHALAFAAVLRKEFGFPFAFYDAASGVPITADASDSKPDAPLIGMHALPPLAPGEVVAFAEEGRSSVQALQPGEYRLQLCLFQAGRP